MTTNNDDNKITPFPGAAAAAAEPMTDKPAAPEGRPIPSAAIAYCSHHLVTREMSISLVKLLVADMAMAQPVFSGRLIEKGAPPYLNLARNTIVEEFLKVMPPEVRALLLVDSDNTWEPEDAYNLLQMLDPVERPVVGGLYFAWDGPRFIARPLLRVKDKTLWNYPGSALVEVDTVGMGFTAIDRGWLEAWREKHGPTWFDFRGTGKHSGFALEDMAFSERVRSTGHKIHVHTGIKIGHMKPIDVSEKLYAALMLQREYAKQPVKVGPTEGRN
jgi:hypothetical protein